MRRRRAARAAQPRTESKAAGTAPSTQRRRRSRRTLAGRFFASGHLEIRRLCRPMRWSMPSCGRRRQRRSPPDARRTRRQERRRRRRGRSDAHGAQRCGAGRGRRHRRGRERRSADALPRRGGRKRRRTVARRRVDPIDGTTLASRGGPGAISVIAAAPRNALFRTRVPYMEKLVTGPAGHGVVDIEAPLEENLRALARAKGREVST